MCYKHLNMWVCHGYWCQTVDLQVHTAFMINVVYSGVTSIYMNNMWGRDLYLDPLKHKTKGQISYAIVLNLGTSHLNYPRGRTLSHIAFKVFKIVTIFVPYFIS
jgi:hypothetical protein